MLIKDWLDKRRRQRLKGDLDILRNEINFNPFAVTFNNHETEDYFSRRITEYRIWSMGNGEVLREFYHHGAISENDYDKINYFWRCATPDIRMIHSGIPGLICSKFPRILFGDGIQVTINVLNEDGKPNDGESKKATDFINNLLDKIKFDDVLTKACTDESWGGHMFLKLSHDIDLSHYPIVESGDMMNSEIVKKRGITTAIIFHSWYEKKSVKYRLDEIYALNDIGENTITYQLFNVSKNPPEQVPLDTVSETADILALPSIDENGTLTFKGLKGLLAFEKPNKLPNREFPHSNYGASDFSGCIDSFDALDETYSEIIAEIRDNKTIRYYPETMLRRDENNDIINPKNSYTTNYVLTAKETDQDQHPNGDETEEIKIQQIPDKTDDNKTKFTTALTTCLNNCGLSPFSIGITGLESINSSAESQQERNKVTIETRSAKLKLYKPFLESFIRQLLLYNSWLIKTQGFKQADFPGYDVDMNMITVDIEFGDYIADTDKQKIEIWGSAKTQGVCSTEEAVQKIHRDWAEDQVQDEVNKIRFEQGMSADNPNNLPELTGTAQPNEPAQTIDEALNGGTGQQ